MRIFLKVVKYTCILIITMSLLSIAISMLIYFPPIEHHYEMGKTDSDFSRTDFITIVLSAISVLLAILGIMMAILGAVGYVAIRDGSKKTARDTAKAIANVVARDTAATVAARTAQAYDSQSSSASSRQNDDDLSDDFMAAQAATDSN